MPGEVQQPQSQLASQRLASYQSAGKSISSSNSSNIKLKRAEIAWFSLRRGMWRRVLSYQRTSK